jgi:hypothetical protein
MTGGPVRRHWRIVVTALAVIIGPGIGVALAESHGSSHSGRSAFSYGKWPFRSLELGLVDPEGDAAALHAAAPLKLRYQYLSGGVNTGRDWEHWATGHGSFATDYVAESVANGFTPVFSFYELRQSLPGANISNELDADMTNLDDRSTMRSYFQDLQTLLVLLGKARASKVVLHVEPDMWGYIEQRYGDNARRAPVQVSATGLPELRGLPNNATGLARAIVHLRNLYAPNVLLAYHLSVWGTDKDLHGSKLTTPQVDQIAARSARFSRSLDTAFDLMFAEFTNSDAGYQQTVLGMPNAFWSGADYARQVRYLGDVHRTLRLPIVLWQIPVGNTLYRTENNTTGHYQDNRVQWLLGGGNRSHLRAYAHAGVVALLFGSGIPQGTCACDADHDGVTNPPPIDGNTRVSTSPDDDGGYLLWRARLYYRAGPMALPRLKSGSH